ncbi:MAG TPA: pectate lyase [Chitinophagaceae bacterium]
MRAAILCLILGLALQVQAQKSTSAKAGSYLDMPWKVVATRMSNDWYASDSARRVAETVLFCQQDIGGWAKNKPYHHPLTDSAKAAIEKSRSRIGATIDNGSTTTEMKFLVKMYNATKEPRYYLAFEKALEYLLAAQYPNGGWPQYYPFRKGSTAYASHITYNDNAMVNVLEVLRDIAEEKPYYAQLPVTPALRARAKQAYDKGIECILKTQITVSGRPTVWCAQHDEATLLPAKARAYELPSFSGQESVGIVHLLMQVKNPSDRIIASVRSAMHWLEDHKVTGTRIENRPGADGKRNIVLVNDAQAPPLLARFYDLETGKPIFADRDGIKKSSLMDIGAERRNGYSWYNDEFADLQKEYKAWLKKWGIQN